MSVKDTLIFSLGDIQMNFITILDAAKYFGGLPGETWGVIISIWLIVLITVILLWIKIKKTGDEEK